MTTDRSCTFLLACLWYLIPVSYHLVIPIIQGVVQLITWNVPFSATVELTASPIDCPGEAEIFNCSILSNSEYIYLTWEIVFPGETPVEFTFDNSSTQNVTMDYGTGVPPISAVFTKYSRDEYIESILLLTLLPLHNGTAVNCHTDIQNVTELVHFETPGTHQGHS